MRCGSIFDVYVKMDYITCRIEIYGDNILKVYVKKWTFNLLNYVKVYSFPFLNDLNPHLFGGKFGNL